MDATPTDCEVILSLTRSTAPVCGFVICVSFGKLLQQLSEFYWHHECQDEQPE
jgi:hypothetical protein